MKLVSYLYRGQRSYGIARAEGIIDLKRRLGLYYDDLKSLLGAQALEEARVFEQQPADIDYIEVTFLPVIDNVYTDNVQQRIWGCYHEAGEV